jgi:hypothetical protein
VQVATAHERFELAQYHLRDGHEEVAISPSAEGAAEGTDE